MEMKIDMRMESNEKVVEVNQKVVEVKNEKMRRMRRTTPIG